jgi:hypothetical protein
MPAAGLSLSLQPCAPHQISVCALHVQVGRRPCVCLDERGIKATPQVAGANRHQVVSCPAAFGRPYTQRPHPSGSTSKQVSCPTANTDEGEKDEGIYMSSPLRRLALIQGALLLVLVLATCDAAGFNCPSQ